MGRLLGCLQPARLGKQWLQTLWCGEGAWMEGRVVLKESELEETVTLS